MLIEGPFESDYSLAIVNRRLTLALLRLGMRVQLHQRDNTRDYAPSSEFLCAWPDLAPHFIRSVDSASEEIHSRCIYPPYTDRMTGIVRAVHCYAWEESAFPRTYVTWFNRDLDVITVVSSYVRDVLVQNGVQTPVEIVGNGADHILESRAERVRCLDADRFHFVHVSSCFPRKGADVLVEVFCREFSGSDRAALIIKTFSNPHNEIETIVAETFRRYPDHAPVKIITDSFSPGQMRYLLEQANCVVAPSRGEGFGLPVAEAMLLNTPVIATIHGGHAELCSPEWCWPVDFTLEQARSHLTEGRSLWAEPNTDSLQARMREVYECDSATIQSKTARAREHIAGRFTWEKVARRHADVCAQAAEQKRELRTSYFVRERFHIGFVTTWNARCGIAEYSRYLSSNLGPNYACSIFANSIPETVRRDEFNVQRCWTATGNPLPAGEVNELADRIHAAGCDAVSVQYNFGLFSPETLDRLIGRLDAKNIPTIVTLHATKNEKYDRLVAVLQRAAGVIVHRPEDRDQLVAAGLSRVYVQHHGVYVADKGQRSTAPGDGDVFTVASFGFFLPVKGIYELIQAFLAASQVNPTLRLKLINSLYDIPESHAYASECVQSLREHGACDRVLVCTEFLDDATIVRELAASDLVVLPYLRSTESFSGAVCLPLASLTPVLCSDIPLFRKLAGPVHLYPALDTVALSNRLIELSSDTQLLRTFEAEQKRYVDELAWTNVALEFESVVNECTAKAGRRTF